MAMIPPELMLAAVLPATTFAEMLSPGVCLSLLATIAALAVVVALAAERAPATSPPSAPRRVATPPRARYERRAAA